MNKLGAISLESIKKTVQEILGGQYKFAILLGSAGTDRFHENSDIDIAVFFNKEKSPSDLMPIISNLAHSLNRECDLVSLQQADPIFSRQVLETGREIDVVDRSSFNLWKADQLSRYPDFKASRKIIEENLLNRKRYV